MAIYEVVLTKVIAMKRRKDNKSIWDQACEEKGTCSLLLKCMSRKRRPSFESFLNPKHLWTMGALQVQTQTLSVLPQSDRDIRDMTRAWCRRLCWWQECVATTLQLDSVVQKASASLVCQ